MLLSKGMTTNYADLLASKYLKTLESQGQIVSIMDLFDTERDDFKAIQGLSTTSL
jgi:hypothetical protein